MSDLLKYKQVNWIDGMKVNKNHFIGLENYFIASLNDIRNNNLNDNNFGLLPLKDDSRNFLNINMVVDNQNYLKVKVLSCHAITPGGYRIEITEDESEQTDFTIQNVETSYNLASANNSDLFLIISTDPFSRIPEGKANPSEHPLRLPLISPEYKLHIIPAEQVVGYKLGPNLLTLSKIVIKNNKPEIDEEYIPPCTSLDSHPKLIELYSYIDKNISSLEKNVVQIIYNVKEKHASNVLTDIVVCISENILYFVSNSITKLRWFLKSAPPIYLFEIIVSLARVLKNTFDTRTAEEKEVLLNYFSEHFDIIPSKFKQLLDSTIALDYEHADIKESIKKTEDFINVISLLFNELRKMELIAGKKKQVEPKKIDIVIR
ncbi:MAG: hypothetical protein B6D61_14215 [Bacteroidetes bacterium 4484_249]|nr:MAG: hypothetical protein B6D61_14215 [Bacteroidetes bacterium 4484_249]